MRIVDVPLRYARCQIIIGDVPTLVDTGTRAGLPRLLRAIRSAGLKPKDIRRIILTHADGDHAGGARALQEEHGAEVWAHADERPYLEGQLPAGFGLVKRAVVALSGRAPTPTIGRWLVDGDTLDDVHIVHTPGHTPGHISLIVGSTVIAGDAFATGARCREVPRLMSADVGASRRAIRALAERCLQRGVRDAFSGHGAPVDGVAERLRALLARLPA